MMEDIAVAVSVAMGLCCFPDSAPDLPLLSGRYQAEKLPCHRITPALGPAIVFPGYRQ